MTGSSGPQSLSIRRRLFIQLLGIAAVLSTLLYLTVRFFAEQAAESAQDNILRASASSIIEAVQIEKGHVTVDLPYAALSMLDNPSHDRVFYQVAVGDRIITGYGDLPPVPDKASTASSAFRTTRYRGLDLRMVTIERAFFSEESTITVTAQVGQTRRALEAISARTSFAAAGFGVGFFALAAVLSLLAAHSALRPIKRLTGAVRRRGAHDLRPFRSNTPKELTPLMVALNGLIVRLSRALSETETFIAEAAHRVRTPLATVRTQAEIALRKTDNAEDRETLRAVIRAVDETSRSAGQLLDHATITLRSDRLEPTLIDMSALMHEVIRDFSTVADLKDIRIALEASTAPSFVHGDSVMLHSALRNLLDNAIKYSPFDSLIAVSSFRTDGILTIAVRDQGRGLGDSGRDELAQRFARGANVSDVIGSGLGLTIVSEVAEAHGGSFTIQPNIDGGGACASLSLPVSS